MPFTCKPQGEPTSGETLPTAECETLVDAINAAFGLWQQYLTPVEIWNGEQRIGVWLGFVFDD